MKKGVAVFGGLILALATCLPAVAQPNIKAVETIVVDNFDAQDGGWKVQASRYASEGYPVLKYFEGIPHSLSVYQPSDVPAYVLGVKTAFDRKGDNWFEVYQENEYEFRGTVTQLDFWVWGANYNYNLELLVRDSEGCVHSLNAGSLKFQGWRNIILNVPTWINQHSRLRNGRRNLSFVGFRVRSASNEAVDNFVIYFDNLKYTSNTLSNIYDGYALKDADFGSGDGE